MRVYEVTEFLSKQFPFETAEEWDNVGLLVGAPLNFVHKIGLTLDITKDIIEEAELEGVDLIISHHPVIFSPIKQLLNDSVPFHLASADISAVAIHTPLDRAENGVSVQLATKIGLGNIRQDDDEPMVVFGTLDEKITTEELARKLSIKLQGCVRYGDVQKEIKTVAVCGGSGASLGTKHLSNLDAFITGDASHHDFLDYAEKDVPLFACGHFETEHIVLPYLQTVLNEEYKNIETIILTQKTPVKYL